MDCLNPSEMASMNLFSVTLSDEGNYGFLLKGENKSAISSEVSG
jgi:hypothetical protein